MPDARTSTESTTWLLSGQLSDDESIRQFAIDRSPFTVGRRPDRALPIPSPTVSGRHAELLLGRGTLRVRDLGSTNGTFVNGVRVEGECVISHGDLVQFAEVVFRVGVDVATHDSQTLQNNSADQALALIQFDQLMNERAITPHFQPILTMDGDVIGHEVLGRSKLFGLSDPRSMFMAAAVLNLEAELSRMMRIEGIRVGAPLPAEDVLFVNTHPVEIDDQDTLVFSLREARETAAERPLVLEIHEATATRTGQMGDLRAALTDLDIGLAYDDFGSGQARLVEIAEAPPDFLKFDIRLVNGISQACAERQKMLHSLVKMTIDLGILPLAEGIEQPEDHKVCRQMGFHSAQGFLYGKPAGVSAARRARESGGRRHDG